MMGNTVISNNEYCNKKQRIQALIIENTEINNKEYRYK